MTSSPSLEGSILRRQRGTAAELQVEPPWDKPEPATLPSGRSVWPVSRPADGRPEAGAGGREERRPAVNPLGKEFVKALRTCGSLAELRVLTARYGSSFDSQAVAALASHLADRSGSGSGAHLLRFMRSEWLPLFRSHLSSMDAAGLCICVQSAAKIGQGRGQDGGRSGETMSQTNASQYASGGSDDAGAWRPVLDEGDLDAVMQAADWQLHSFSSRSAVQLLWGLVSQVRGGEGSWLGPGVTIEGK